MARVALLRVDAASQERPMVSASSASSAGSAAPRIGVVCRPEFPPRIMRDFVRAAERAGLDDVWLWEDCFLSGGFTAATAAAGWTESIRIGIGLIPVPLRNVALAAMEIAATENLLPGRILVGAGHGVRRWMQQTGTLPASPMTQLREWVTAIRALLRGDEVTADGTYVRLEGVRLDWPPAASPPLLLGARGPRTLALAGELTDGVILDAGLTPDGVRQALAAAAGPPGFQAIVYLPCGKAGDAATLEAGLDPARGAGPQRLAVGDAAQIAERIREFAEAGATTIALQPAANDPEPFATLDLIAGACQRLRAR
jgi:alkanesulfonate monooxygenase SsuD/methylene tetrahydromethanopterin reductase-like flavin-dependent oxidoreductase (luciferase family)